MRLIWFLPDFMQFLNIMGNRLYSLLIVLVAFMAVSVKAQDAPSPFSSVGMGMFSGMNLIQNESMGGLGIGTASYWSLNNNNPALLLNGKKTIFGELTTFQTGINSESRRISTPDDSQVSQGSGLEYVSTGFPIIRNKWFTSLGIRPYSVSNYNLNYEREVAGSGNITNVKETGSGGLNQIYIANGVAITEKLNVGLTSHIVFGAFKKEYNSSVELVNIPPGYEASVFQRFNVSGILLKGGISYQDSIRIKSGKPLKLTVGATYDFRRKIKGIEFESLQLKNLSGPPLDADTTVNEVPGNVTFPSSLGFGVSLARDFKWMLGIDGGIHNYEEIEIFGERGSYIDGLFFNLGIEVTPNAFSVDKYLERITFRSGLKYEQLPYLINGTAINDFGINFGVSLPIVPSQGASSMISKGFSTVDLGFGFGKQGNVETSGIEETYFKFKFGVTFNDRWFIRRKFN